MDNFDLESNEIEALLRSAGEYVRPSDDLRPAVLEQARVARAEWRAQSWVWYVALSIAVCVVLASQVRVEPATDFEVQPAPASVSQRDENPGWYTVDGFSAVRRRQAALLFRVME
jgi:hypothetical protein